MADDQARIDELQRLIDGCTRAVVFTGAGISTESGIPDFRSPGGVWTRYSPIQYQDFVSSHEARVESWRRKFDDSYGFDGAEPNRGHRAVEKLVRIGKVSAVITQNTDGLHLASGISDDQVIELHGNSTYAACLDCGLRHDLEPIRQVFLADGTVPVCCECGGHVKGATISFGVWGHLGARKLIFSLDLWENSRWRGLPKRTSSYESAGLNTPGRAKQ